MNGRPEPVIDVTGRSVGDALVERYSYLPGPAVALDRHAHETYQLCYNPDYTGQVWLAGGWHTVPAGTLTVVSPGETHAVRDVADRDTAGSYRVLYLTAQLIGAVAGELHRGGEAPVFRGLVQDGRATAGFLRLHDSLERDASRLRRDSLLWTVMGGLVHRHGAHRPRRRGPAPSTAGSARAARLVRDHLHDNVTGDVSLEELARLSGFSRFHLLRVFRRHYGLPPHAYQVQARVERAKRILADGHGVTRAAHDSGFFDATHLTRHFRRIVGVTPGRYASTRSLRRPEA